METREFVWWDDCWLNSSPFECLVHLRAPLLAGFLELFDDILVQTQGYKFLGLFDWRTTASTPHLVDCVEKLGRQDLCGGPHIGKFFVGEFGRVNRVPILLRKAMVGSIGQRNIFGEFISGRSKAKCLARSSIQSHRDRVQISLAIS